MATVNSYLNFDGTAEEAFLFYRTVLGGDFAGGIMKMGSAPGAENLSDEMKNRVLHVSLPIGDNLLMGSDIVPEMGQKLQTGNSNYISLHTDSRADADRIFTALAEGGEVEMPIEDQFWGDYFGSLQDKFGIFWMINFNEAYT